MNLNYILYFVVLVILFLLLINKIRFFNKEDFNNDVNGNIVILNKIIRNINKNKSTSGKSKFLEELITLDTITI